MKAQRKEELKFIYKVWSGYTKYIRSQAAQGRCIHCPFLGKIVKRSVLEEGQKKYGGPKRGDKPFTTSLFGSDPSIEYSMQNSYGHKKYCYIPSIDFIETSNLQYKEDYENLSPLYDTLGVKVMQISYSSIAVACNSTKSTVLNCLKEIFSTIVYLVKQGNEISLDIKIGIMNIMKDNKLMFRNYNPDIKIAKKRTTSQGVDSEISHVPTSVATPLTNLNSTLSFRGRSQDAPARQVSHHVGFKRNGPSYQYNSDNNKREGEKQYYRHKKDPYHNLDSFLSDERFEIENKIQNIRLQERQQILNMKKKERRGMSNSFYELNENRTKLNNSSYAPSKINATRQTFMGSTGDVIKSNKAPQELNDFEPSTVNDKIPSKFVIDYPNFLKPAKYHPYRRLEDYHVADVI